MTEADLSKKIARALRDRGAWAVKTHGDPRQRRGLPDIIGCYRSIFFGLEVKRPGRESTLTPLQNATLEDIRSAGGVGRMITSVEQALQLLTLIDRYKG
jgi:Holliday junction resolvase